MEYIDLFLLIMGFGLWIHGGMTGDRLAVEVGFMAVVVAIGTSAGWL